MTSVAAAAESARPRPAGLNLLGIMVIVAGFAILFWLLAPAFRADGSGKASQILDGFIILLVIAFVVLGIGTISILIHRGRAERDMALWMLSLAAARGMPLAPALRSYAQRCSAGRLLQLLLCTFHLPITAWLLHNSQGALWAIIAFIAPILVGLAAMFFGWGNLRRKVNRAAEALEGGVSLPDTIRGCRGLFGRQEELLVRVGLESGRLAEGLRLASDQRRSRRLLRSAFLNKLLYTWTILFFLTIAAIMLSFLFAPRMLRICADFGVQSPAPLSMIDAYASKWFEYSFFSSPDGSRGRQGSGAILAMIEHLMGNPTFLAILSIYLLGYLVLLLMSLDLRSSIVPGLDRIFRQQERSLVQRSLALGIEGKRPLAPLLAALVQWHHRSWIRSRLVRTYGGIASGQYWCEALRSSGLIGRREADLLSSAERAGNLPWAFRELADAGDRRFLNRVRAWTQLLYVAALLAIGALVLLFALAYFPPLIHLIERMNER